MDASVPRPRSSTPIAAVLRVAALTLAVIIAGNTRAATPPSDVFNVELVVFRYKGTIASPENWDEPAPAPVAAGDTAANGTSAESNTAAQAVRPLGPAQFQLAGTEAALRRNASYEPIAHFGFRIAAGERDSGSPVRIEPLVEGTSGLTGSVTLERGRFLHLALDLAYTTANPPATLLTPGTAPGLVTFWIHQDRRMRPFERHYFDHPAFGVVAIVTPVAGAD
jgi:hypothetical protein